MFKFNNKRKGSALVIVLIIMLVLSILGTAIMRVAVAENTFAKRNEDRLQAYYIARSGAQSVAEYMIRDAHGDAKDLIGKDSKPKDVSGGSLNVSVDKNDGVIHIISEGEYRGVKQYAKVILNESTWETDARGVFDHAIAAIDSVTKGGNANHAVIEGSVAVKNSVPDVGNATVKGGAKQDQTLYFPSINFDKEYDDKVPGNGIIKNLTVATDPNSTKRIYAKGINMGNGDSITVTGGGTLHLYVDVRDDNGEIENEVLFGNKSQLIVKDNSKLLIYTNATNTIEFIGTEGLRNAVIYAPEAKIEFNNANLGTFYGAIYGKVVQIHTHTNLVFAGANVLGDIDLDTSFSGVTYTGYIWID